MLSYLAYPQEGHVDATFHVMGYMKHKHNSRLVFDPTYPFVDLNMFETGKQWQEFYHEAKDAIPPNDLKPRGNEVDLRTFVDSDHVGDKTNR